MKMCIACIDFFIHFTLKKKPQNFFSHQILSSAENNYISILKSRTRIENLNKYQQRFCQDFDVADR